MAAPEQEEISFLDHIEREEKCYNHLAFCLGASFMVGLMIGLIMALVYLIFNC